MLEKLAQTGTGKIPKNQVWIEINIPEDVEVEETVTILEPVEYYDEEAGKHVDVLVDAFEWDSIESESWALRQLEKGALLKGSKDAV